MMRIPERFKKYIFDERKNMIIKMMRGEVRDEKEIYLWFTRALPAIVSNGPAGLNASIKMVGFVVKEEYLEETVSAIKNFVNSGKKSHEEVLQFLLRYIYDENRLDLSKLATLDLAKKRTWANLRDGGEAVLIFFTPPDTSFMVKVNVEVHLDGLYFEYVNALHDLFHVVPQAQRIVGRHPTYIFKIREIWDKSVDAFGKKIYP